jgi:formamidopyrimidine-DNA glycosylase
MPELPEVETIRRGLEPALVGASIKRVRINRPDLRFPLPERFNERLTGRKVLSLGRRAKYLVLHLDGGEVLIVHLGMTGRLLLTRPGSLHPRGSRGFATFANETCDSAKHDHVVLDLSNGYRLTFNDTRRFGYMDLIAEADLPSHKLFRNLGVEPLSNDLTADYLAARAAGRSVDLKALLMDQGVIAGLGNIYVCESLYRARLDPRSPAGGLAKATGKPTNRAARLVTAVREVIGEAICAGGSTLRDYVQADGAQGEFQLRHDVYDREGEPCWRPGCGGTIRRIVSSGRATFYCPRCQR